MTIAESPSRVNLNAGPHRVDVEPTPRWVRVEFNDVTIVDSKNAILLRETGHTPVYYFPQADVRMDLFTPTTNSTHCPYKGDASYWSITVGDRTAKDAVWSYLNPLPGREDIAGYVAFYWNRVDHWYEEAEEIFAHARDPYHRVDTISSTRRVRIFVGGEVVADTSEPRILFETGLPNRYYIPLSDIRMERLVSTETSSICPYKGVASYWKMKDSLDGKDIAWSYLNPIPECPAITAYISFYNERVEAIEVDGQVEPKPRTKWS